MGIAGAFFFLIGAICFVAGAWLFGVPFSVLGLYMVWWDNKHNEPKRKERKRQKQLAKQAAREEAQLNRVVQCNDCGWKGRERALLESNCCPRCRSGYGFRYLS